MNRRTFVKTAAAATAALAPLAVAASWADDAAVPTVYFVDGYHGGIRGHMKLGCWRDILDRMREFTAWKVSLDIEPDSYRYVRQRDPEAFHELTQHLNDAGPAAHMEICGGTYAQPFAWLFSGESLIRQLATGLQVLREQFPKVKVETYAGQEPCFTSAMPQVLLSFGFARSAEEQHRLRRLHGRSRRRRGEVGWPRRQRDHRGAPLRVRRTHGSLVERLRDRLGEVRPQNAQSRHHAPTGMAFQDIGWAAHPRTAGQHIRFVTWREYFETVAPKAVQQWAITQEDIKGNLPWGSATLQAIGARNAFGRRSLGGRRKNGRAGPRVGGPSLSHRGLAEAWKNTLDSQHHDAWVVATHGQGRNNWAWQVGTQTWLTEKICDDVIAGACQALSAGSNETIAAPLGPRCVRVFNTTGSPRTEIAELRLNADVGTQSVRVIDEAGNAVTCQLVPQRKYLPHGTLAAMSDRKQVTPPTAGLKPVEAMAPGEPVVAEGTSGPIVSRAESRQWRHGRPVRRRRTDGDSARRKFQCGRALVLRRDAPAGLRHLSHRARYDDKPRPPWRAPVAVPRPDGTVLIETDRCRVRLDPKRGGAITSIFDKQLHVEFVDSANQRLFNEYRGYFINEKEWFTSASQPAEVQIIENGPLRVRIALAGRVGEHPFACCVTLANGTPRIDFRVRFRFKPDTWIGDPYRVPPAESRSQRRRSYHDDRWKLNAFFPVALPKQTIYKDAAYDVCRSKLADTFYQRWDEVKHNIILNWIDVADEEKGLGMALFSDPRDKLCPRSGASAGARAGLGLGRRAVLRRLPLGRRSRSRLFHPARTRGTGTRPAFGGRAASGPNRSWLSSPTANRPAATPRAWSAFPARASKCRRSWSKATTCLCVCSMPRVTPARGRGVVGRQAGPHRAGGIGWPHDPAASDHARRRWPLRSPTGDAAIRHSHVAMLRRRLPPGVIDAGSNRGRRVE